ncbi:hypothetical protein EJB05_23743 [Eragrostis curvula]|uniref:Uncharacterized protein n=1 Tax=Eragrostis curvula TaxID=38414 RepID=A0A5J9V9E7_9POAL|nr:hypothetical protein EJB05_23743 [Eragrostis curvula]
MGASGAGIVGQLAGGSRAAEVESRGTGQGGVVRQAGGVSRSGPARGVEIHEDGTGGAAATNNNAGVRREAGQRGHHDAHRSGLCRIACLVTLLRRFASLGGGGGTGRPWRDGLQMWKAATSREAGEAAKRGSVGKGGFWKRDSDAFTDPLFLFFYLGIIEGPDAALNAQQAVLAGHLPADNGDHVEV